MLMKKILFCLIFSLSGKLKAEPKLFFTDARPYDHICVRGFDYANVSKKVDGSAFNEKWLTEIRQRMFEFQNSWDSVAPQLFKVFIQEFKHDFKRKEYSVALSVCPDSPSMPKPLILNVSRYLRSYMSPKKPKEMRQFTDVVFHELIHLWLNENFNYETTIKTKYKSEGDSVVNHIHLFAIESLVLEKAGLSDVWDNAKSFFAKKGGPHLTALKIMEKEGRAKVLKELQ